MHILKHLSSEKDEKVMPNLQRRNFLKYMGMGAALATATSLAACHKDHDYVDNGVSLGSGDFAVLNFAYALEQLEAAFYTQIVASPYSGITPTELEFFTDIRNHEIGHRDFFKKALSTNAIIGLEVDFSSIDFSSRASVLATAKAFEDLGVSAYNGAAQYISSTDTGKAYLLLAGKIVSVEARHAAYIRDLIEPGSFAGNDVVDANGLDTVRTPAQVFAIAGKYIKTKINANTLPHA
ncbi:ferritin-like domain-containing protein [Chitinophaga silvatica]|uniref:Ferritin-like domain-containing protein n=1 Tax=Chitinophaga silvatica TaxID=2282649 RepID=A0A3E1YCI1_9BACT|nr:ferritin-like domain-containing protein [Chitinophaga silvatica]RFS23504.1 ferritin-like domain-containing protein [Chitinophaga silvatica]